MRAGIREKGISLPSAYGEKTPAIIPVAFAVFSKAVLQNRTRKPPGLISQIERAMLLSWRAVVSASRSSFVMKGTALSRLILPMSS